LPSAQPGTEKEVQSVIEGEIKQIHLRVPDFANNVTLAALD